MSMASDSHAQQRALTFFQYGNDAAMKANFDYAIQMYHEACKLDPSNLKFRQALRGIERRRFDNDLAKVGRLVGAKTQPIKRKARSAKSKGHNAEALEICEEAFVHNPWDVGAARTAAEAAVQMGLTQLAAWYIESVQAQAQNDADFLRHAAEVFKANSEFTKAIQCWEKVKKINPNDEDARHEINALSASATIQRSGLGEAIHKHEAEAAASEPEMPEPRELKGEKLTPEARLQREIQEHPDRVGPYLDMAEILRKRSRLDEAQKLLAAGLKVVPKDPNLLEAYAEVQMARLQKAIASWTQRCRERPGDAAAKAKLDQLTEKLNEYEIQEYQRRVDLHPEDFNLHYQLGLRLARVGRHKEAIGAFQQARSSPALKVQALHQAGLSFEADGLLKLAERNYQEALKAVDPSDQSVLNELHYRLGRVAEAQGNTSVAEEHYNEVAANDYSYLDVAQRLRGLS
jgi:tetratricopeptide (TPR) repeat protein